MNNVLTKLVRICVKSSSEARPIKNRFNIFVDKGETITRVNGNVSFTAGKRLQNF